MEPDRSVRWGYSHNAGWRPVTKQIDLGVKPELFDDKLSKKLGEVENLTNNSDNARSSAVILQWFPKVDEACRSRPEIYASWMVEFVIEGRLM